MKKIGVLLLWLFSVSLVYPLYAQSIELADILGSDVQNAGDQKKIESNQAKINLYRELGLSWVRASGGSQQWWVDGQPTPENFDPVITYATERGFKVYLHIEYRPDLEGGSVYDYDWFAVGRDFCRYFGNKVEVYDIINEVDHDEATISTEDFVAIYEDFVAGVRSVDPNKLIAIQLAGTPMRYEKSAAFFEATKELFNSGKVQIMNLHTYNNYGRREDIYKGTEWAQFQNFVRWKEEIGITADVLCASGEFQWRSDPTNQDVMALGVMPVLYSQLAVQQSTNTTDEPRTLFANIFALTWADSTRGITCAKTWEVSSPTEYTWVPNARGRVYQEQLKITRGMKLVHTDVYGKGAMVLRGDNRKGWVYFGIKGFGSESGASQIEVRGIPLASTELAVYTGTSTAEEPMAIVPLDSQSSAQFQIPTEWQNQTLLLVADSDDDGGTIGEVNAVTSTEAPIEDTTLQRGSILHEWWDGINGTDVADLTENVNYPNSPSGSEWLPELKVPVNTGSQLGTRIRGYLHPPVSGNYTFWISSDDQGELWLSTDVTSEEKRRIAWVPEWSDPHDWDKYATQQSVVISLEADKKYYIEALRKEGRGGDHLAVAWSGPGIERVIVAGDYLSPAATPSVQFTEEGATASGLPAPEADASFTSHPNPFEQTTQLSYRLSKNSHVHVLVHDALGKQVMSEMMGWQTAGFHTITLNSDRLTKGVLTIQLRTNEGTQVLRVIAR